MEDIDGTPDERLEKENGSDGPGSKRSNGFPDADEGCETEAVAEVEAWEPAHPGGI